MDSAVIIHIKSPPSSSKNPSSNINNIGILSMFRFSDTIDICLMLFGSISALADGIILPLIAYTSSKLFNNFANKDSNLLVERSK